MSLQFRMAALPVENGVDIRHDSQTIDVTNNEFVMMASVSQPLIHYLITEGQNWQIALSVVALMTGIVFGVEKSLKRESIGNKF